MRYLILLLFVVACVSPSSPNGEAEVQASTLPPPLPYDLEVRMHLLPEGVRYPKWSISVGGIVPAVFPTPAEPFGAELECGQKWESDILGFRDDWSERWQVFERLSQNDSSLVRPVESGLFVDGRMLTCTSRGFRVEADDIRKAMQLLPGFNGPYAEHPERLELLNGYRSNDGEYRVYSVAADLMQGQVVGVEVPERKYYGSEHGVLLVRQDSAMQSVYFEGAFSSASFDPSRPFELIGREHAAPGSPPNWYVYTIAYDDGWIEVYRPSRQPY